MDQNSIFQFDDVNQEEFSSEEFWKKFIPLLQGIENKKFGENHPKAKITQTYKSLNCGCPYCGDGRFMKRRFHVYYESMSCKCFNDCPHPFHSLYQFIKDYELESHFTYGELNYIKYVFDEYMKTHHGIGNVANTKLITNNVVSTNIETGVQTVELPEIDQYAFPREEIMKARKLREVRYSPACVDYLMKRKIIKNKQELFDKQFPHFAYNDYRNDLYMFNLASNNRDILGIQIRHLNPKMKRRFTSIVWSDIWKQIIGVEPSNIDELKQKFDKQSMMWNFLHVDYSKPFYILEGVIDAYFLIPNAIACLGLSNFVYNYSARYITDNTLVDTAGKSKALELLSNGYTTLLWGKMAEDYPEVCHDCKDINDIVKKYPNFDFSVLDQYFGNDELDTIWL